VLHIVLTVATLAGLGGCDKEALPAGRQTEKSKMPLDVQFRIAKTNLLAQEDPNSQVILVNNGKAPVNILNPEFNPHMPVLRVMEVKTGMEMLQQRKAPMTGDKWTPLGPGQQIDSIFPLLSRAKLSLPVEYEISCIELYDNGKSKAESNALRVTITPVTPRSLSLVYVQGGWAAMEYGVSVNVATDPPMIVRHAFDVMAGGGVIDAQPVVKTSLRSAPVISAGANKVVMHAHWIGWIEDKAVCFTHFEPSIGALGVSKWNPGDLDAEVVGPMHSDPMPDMKVRPAGAALVWVGDPNANASTLQVLNISPAGKISPGARLAVMGARPQGLMSHERADGTRVATYAQKTAGGVALQAVTWHDQGTPRKLAEWPDADFIAQGGTLTMEDQIRGASLILKNPKGMRTPEVVAWRLDAKGNFTEEKRHAIQWPYAVAVSKGVVRVDPWGNPAVLLADQAGNWSVYDGKGNTTAAPPPYTTTKLPIDLAFLRQAQPVLIVGDISQGYRIVQLNGKPLPERGG